MTDGCCGGDHAPQSHQLNFQTTGEQSAVTNKDLLTVANYLLNQKASGLKPRTGIFNGKRAQYFKGKSAVNALMRENYAKTKGPVVATRDDALQLLSQLLLGQMFLRCERGEAHSAGGKSLQPHSMQEMNEEHYYAWLYEGSQLGTMLGGIALVGLVFAGVMFPLWPQVMRDGAWYLSIGVLGLIGLLLAITAVRLVLFVITYLVANPGIWIFPNLYEDVGFVDSFIPFWAWAEPAKKKGKQAVAPAVDAADTKPATATSTARAPLLERIDDAAVNAAANVRNNDYDDDDDDENVEELIADRKDS